MDIEGLRYYELWDLEGSIRAEKSKRNKMFGDLDTRLINILFKAGIDTPNELADLFSNPNVEPKIYGVGKKSSIALRVFVSNLTGKG